MRTEKLNSALLSTLIMISLMAPAVAIVSILTVGQVSAEPGPYENIVRGKVTAYNIDQTNDPPWQSYPKGSRPPIIVAENNIGLSGGAVVAAGIANVIRNGYWNDDLEPGVNPLPHLDDLLDAAFEWMVSGASEVLWYEGYGVYGDTTACSDMVTALTDKGYTISTTENAFENINFAPYDILIINQLQLGAPGTGGDPDLLPDVDVTAIKNFVEGGKGLLIADGSDYFPYQFYKVQNKILKDAFEFPMYFQNDQVIDDDNNFGEDWQIIVDVDTATDIGSAYQTATGKTTIGLPSACSLAPVPDYAVSVTISPDYLEGLPGGTLKPYTVKVTNMGTNTDSYDLTPTDNSGWELTLSQTSLPNVPSFFNSETVTLSVNVPENAVPGTADNVTVTVDGTGVSDDFWCLAIAGRRIRPTIDDAQVVEGEPDRTAGVTTFMYVGSATTGQYKNERAFLKFDLQGIASSDNITDKNARLFLYEFLVNGTPGKNVELRKVENDNWDEEDICWNDQPSYGEVIGTMTVTEADTWYSWDVTTYLAAEFASDKIASFCIKPETEGLAYDDNFSYGFDTKDYTGAWAHPRIAIGRNVWVTIDPEYREGLPLGTVKYTVNIWNMSSQDDSYTLENSDNSGWGLALSPSVLAVPAGERRTAELSVTIPENARICVDNDNITVTVTSENDSTVKDDAWTIAHPAKRVKPAMPDTSTKNGDYLAPTIWGIDDTIYVGRYSRGPERGWLRFDLEAIPSLENIARARLNLHTINTQGEGAIVQVHSVANDTWTEDENWTSTPPIGSVLDTRAVTEADTWYSWDVTSFVQQEFQSDNLASFALVHLGENIDTTDNAARFTSRDDWDAQDEWPYLEILCESQLPEKEVRTNISPVYQGGIPGTTLNFTVTVKNTGTSSDTYSLTVDDNLGWGATVLPTSLPINAGASDTATLNVTVPSGTACTIDRITVIATGTGVSDNTLCYAHLSKSGFKIENLYQLRIELNVRLREDADNLVAKFYTYTDAYQAAYLIHWENMPYHLISIEYIPHPKGEKVPVENVHLVLEDGGAEIATVATWTVRRTHLIGRISKIKGIWPFATPPERSGLMQEISGIKGQWAFAPP